MNRSVNIKKLANTKWSELSDRVLEEVLTVMKRFDKRHKNVRTILAIDNEQRTVFFDFTVMTDFETVMLLSDIRIDKVYLPTSDGFKLLTDLSAADNHLLTYSALGYMRLL